LTLVSKEKNKPSNYN